MKFACAIGVVLLAAEVPAAAPAAGSFVATGGMSRVRNLHSSTLLADGRVLVAGGVGPPPEVPGASAEIYDPRTGTFARTGDMVRSRATHAAVRLDDGRVLLVGGRQDKSAEIYDPSTGTFAATGEMLARAGWLVAALLGNGKVLVAGDEHAELFDPATGRFAVAGQDVAGRYATQIEPTSATRLADGRVLLVGNGAMLYDPATNTFGATGWIPSPQLAFAYELQSATLLADGRVLIAGGLADDLGPLGISSYAQIYDPVPNAIGATSRLLAPRSHHDAVRLHDGRVLVVGGQSAACSNFGCIRRLASSELYDPATGRFEPGSDMTTARVPARATLLQSGEVLVTGGADASADLYRPPPSSVSYQGLWWASPAGSEPGWGLQLTHQGDILFATWTTYDADGSPVWLAMPRGERDPAGDFAGTLYRVTGPGFDAAFDPARVAATAAGRATFMFSDAGNGLFAHELDGARRAKPITRFIFAGASDCRLGAPDDGTPNYDGAWWASPAGSEPGWGLHVAHQGDVIFATWLTFEAPGRATWFVMPRAPRAAGGLFEGPLYTATGPALATEPWDATRVAAMPVGAAALAFTRGDEGAFSATVGARRLEKRITRFAYSSPLTVCR